MTVHQIDMWQWKCDCCKRLATTNRKIVPTGWEKEEERATKTIRHYCPKCWDSQDKGSDYES